MLKEKNPLPKLELKEEISLITHIINNFFESIYALYDYILDNPIENFWFECITIVLSYLQLISFAFDKIVRKLKYIIYSYYINSFGRYGAKII